MKKNLIFVLAMCLLFSLTACGISENEPKPTAEPLEKTVSPATEPPGGKTGRDSCGRAKNRCCRKGVHKRIRHIDNKMCACRMYKTNRLKRGYQLLYRSFWHMRKMRALHRRGCDVVHEMSDLCGEWYKIVVRLLLVIVIFFKRHRILLLHGETQHLSQQNIQPVGFLLFFLRS